MGLENERKKVGGGVGDGHRKMGLLTSENKIIRRLKL